MQVNGINSFSNVQAFRGTEDKKTIDKKTAAAIGTGAAVAAAAVGATAVAASRGKLVTDDGAKFFTKVKEGFKTFAGEGRKNYLEKVQAKLQDLLDNGKKLKDGTYEALSEDAAKGVKAKIDKVGEKIKTLTEKLAKKAEKAAQGAGEVAKEAGKTAENLGEAAANV